MGGRAAVLLLGVLLGATPGFAAGEGPAPSPSFAAVSLKVLTVGERQAPREAGAFTAHLPLGKTGVLDRRLTVENETRKTRLELDLHLTVKPLVGEDGGLRCLLLAEAAPPGGTPVSRARELLFSHPGAQVMEAYADAATATRVLVSVEAALDSAPPPEPPPLPPLLFFVRVEKWLGAHRVELEALQLQSLDGLPVSHDYERRVPRWVDGEAGEGGEDLTAGLPVVEPGKDPPALKAGQSFSIALEPPKPGKEKKASSPASGREALQKEPPPRKVAWETERYRLEITPLGLEGGRLRLRVAVRGRPLSAEKVPLPEVVLQEEKTLRRMEPVPFYLTQEGPAGPAGYVVWVVPRWEAPETPEALPSSPEVKP